MHKSYKEYSKESWGHNVPRENPETYVFYVGCLQRIADSLEVIAATLDPEEREKKRRRAEKNAKHAADREVRIQKQNEFYAAIAERVRQLYPNRVLTRETRSRIEWKLWLKIQREWPDYPMPPSRAVFDSSISMVGALTRERVIEVLALKPGTAIAKRIMDDLEAPQNRGRGGNEPV